MKKMKNSRRAVVHNLEDFEAEEAYCELLDASRQENLETPAVRREASEKPPRAFWPRRSSESDEEESQQGFVFKRKPARAQKILKKTIVEQEKESTSGAKRKQTELAGGSRLKSTKLEPAQCSEQPTVQEDRPAQPHEAEDYMPREPAPEAVFPLHSADLLSPAYGAMQKGLRDMLADQTLQFLGKSKKTEIPIAACTPDYLCAAFQKKGLSLKTCSIQPYPVLDANDTDVLPAGLRLPIADQEWERIWETPPYYSDSVCKLIIGNMWFSKSHPKAPQADLMNIYWGPRTHIAITSTELNDLFGTPNRGEQIFCFGKGCPETQDEVYVELHLERQKNKEVKMLNEQNRLLILFVSHCIYGKVGRYPSNLELIVAHRLKRRTKMNFGSLFIAMMMQHYRRSEHICLAPLLMKIAYCKLSLKFFAKDLERNMKTFGQHNERNFLAQKDFQIQKIEEARQKRKEASLKRSITQVTASGFSDSRDDTQSVPGTPASEYSVGTSAQGPFKPKGRVSTHTLSEGIRTLSELAHDIQHTVGNVVIQLEKMDGRFKKIEKELMHFLTA